mmetsp:Transcript_5410/g.14610  ORF Transcript_5410/g.14610 Transcript_5410/m.14610 type:complete len:361 (+) Transcript_5410:1249-2331(+)
MRMRSMSAWVDACNCVSSFCSRRSSSLTFWVSACTILSKISRFWLCSSEICASLASSSLCSRRCASVRKSTCFDRYALSTTSISLVCLVSWDCRCISWWACSMRLKLASTTCRRWLSCRSCSACACSLSYIAPFALSSSARTVVPWSSDASRCTRACRLSTVSLSSLSFSTMPTFKRAFSTRMRAASSADLSEASRAPDAARWRCSLSAASLDVASCTAILTRSMICKLSSGMALSSAQRASLMRRLCSCSLNSSSRMFRRGARDSTSACLASNSLTTLFSWACSSATSKSRFLLTWLTVCVRALLSVMSSITLLSKWRFSKGRPFGRPASRSFGVPLSERTSDWSTSSVSELYVDECCG